MDGLPQPPQPPPPPPPGCGGKDGPGLGDFGSGFQPQGSNGGFGGPEGYAYGSQGGYPASYGAAPGGYGAPGDVSYGGGFGAPPPPPQSGAPGYGGYPGGYDMYQQGFTPPPPGSYGGSYSSFDAGRSRDFEGRDRDMGRDSGRDGGRGYDGGRGGDRGADRGSDRGDRGRRDFDRPGGGGDRGGGDRGGGGRDYDRGGRDYDRGDRSRGYDDRAADRRDSGKGYDFGKGYGRGVPLPEPVDLQLKNLPLDATEAALRSLFGQKGLTFDSVEFYVTANMTVSSQSQAEKVIQAFHMTKIAGRSIECVQAQETRAHEAEPAVGGANAAVVGRAATRALHGQSCEGTAAGPPRAEAAEEEEEADGRVCPCLLEDVIEAAVHDSAVVTPGATREVAVAEVVEVAMMAGPEAREEVKSTEFES
ncbi:unnamed protein product [Symbiodinium natans]|uniref:RRM domain-containing protein n=1 Tax=Symbiodinium natans TaxID=878477 RepID=A0A812UA57_9DINO|nr:unnamed protein product [Symbiodinium natans]